MFITVKNKERKSMKLKNLAKVFSVAAVMALAMALMVGCSSGNSKSDSDYKLVNDGKLTVAASLDFPPFESLDGDTPTGYGVAVIQEVAKRLNLECEIKNTKFEFINRYNSWFSWRNRRRI